MKISDGNGMCMALVALSLGVGVMPALAQDNGGVPPPRTQQGPGGRRDPAQMEARQLEMMTEHLKLTPDQVTQVKAIQENQRAEMLALRKDTTVPQEDKRGKMMALRQDSDGKIRAVLTDDQKPKFDEMLARQRERMANRQGGPGGPPPPAPPQ